MNLSSAKSVFINNKEVKEIYLDDKLVYRSSPIRLTASKDYILVDETVVIGISSGELKNIEIELFKVINMTRTSLGTLTTDENGQASYTYTGTGAGNVGFVAVYDEKDSNIVTVDDYTPAVTSVSLVVDNGYTSASFYGVSIPFYVTVKDQHDQPIVGETVTIKNGSTTIGTATTDSTGVATLTKSDLNAGSYAFTATAGSITSNTKNWTIIKASTTLTIECPALVYSDVFDVTGVLKRGNTPIANATITLEWIWGSSVNRVTATTNSSGEVTFHRDAPTTLSTYWFELKYAGDSNHNSATSGQIYREIGKETSVLAVTTPASGATISSGTMVVSGTIKDNDGTPLSGHNVYVRKTESGSNLAILTADSNGAFTGSIDVSSWSLGSNTFYVIYGGGNYYTNSQQSINVTISQVYPASMSLSKTAGKNILSYADVSSGTEYCTVEAEVIGSEGDPYEGATVTFKVYDSDDTLLETLTASGATGPDGCCDATFTSKGYGDIYIKAECNLLTQTYTVEDCSLHFANEKSQTGNNTNEIISGFTFPNTDKWVWEYDMKSSGASTIPCLSDTSAFTHRLGLGANGTPKLTIEQSEIGQNAWDTNQGNFTYNTYYSFKIIRNGNNMEYYINGVLKSTIDAETPLGSTSVSISTIDEWELHWRNWGSGTTTIKNLKIKPL